MAKVCEVCQRGPRFGNRVSHAHNITKRRWNLNLQTVHAVVKGAPKRIRSARRALRAEKFRKRLKFPNRAQRTARLDLLTRLLLFSPRAVRSIALL